MIKHLQHLFILTTALALFACSSKPERHSEAQQSLATNVRPDGSKRFVFLLENSRETQGSGERGRTNSGEERGKGRGNREQGTGGQRNRPSRQQGSSGELSATGSKDGRSDESVREDFLSLLEQQLLDSEYCRHGYIELDYSQLPGRTELTGECQESASEEDKKRWD